MKFSDSEDLKKVTYRRLVLSKQLYLHGLSHSNDNGSLNKMIAIHNFHNAIEITLRAIILAYEIRTDKQLNIDFETMLKEIDDHDVFRSNKIKLPYRQEVRSLNTTRNMVQHQAFEPESATMDDWKVFTKKFLIKSFEKYFDINFDSISFIDIVSDESLKSLLKVADRLISNKDYLNSIVSSKLAFMLSSNCIADFLPNEGFNSDFFAISNLGRVMRSLDNRISQDIENTIRNIYKGIKSAKKYAALLSSGIHLAEYKRFEKLTPHVAFTLDGNYVVQQSKEYESNEEKARLVLNFVVSAIVTWQLHSLNPEVSESLKFSCQKIIDEKSDLLI